MAKFLAYSATVIIIVAVIGFSLEVKAENIDCAPVLLLEKSLTCAEDITVLSECIEQFKTALDDSLFIEKTIDFQTRNLNAILERLAESLVDADDASWEKCVDRLTIVSERGMDISDFVHMLCLKMNEASVFSERIRQKISEVQKAGTLTEKIKENYGHILLERYVAWIHKKEAVAIDKYARKPLLPTGMSTYNEFDTEFKKAEKHFRIWEKICLKLLVSKETVQEVFDNAHRKFQNKKYQEAIDMFNKAIGMDAEYCRNRGVKYAIGQCYEQLKEYDTALKYYRQSIYSEPQGYSRQSYMTSFRAITAANSSSSYIEKLSKWHDLSSSISLSPPEDVEIASHSSYRSAGFSFTLMRNIESSEEKIKYGLRSISEYEYMADKYPGGWGSWGGDDGGVGDTTGLNGGTALSEAAGIYKEIADFTSDVSIQKDFLSKSIKVLKKLLKVYKTTIPDYYYQMDVITLWNKSVYSVNIGELISIYTANFQSLDISGSEKSYYLDLAVDEVKDFMKWAPAQHWNNSLSPKLYGLYALHNLYAKEFINVASTNLLKEECYLKSIEYAKKFTVEYTPQNWEITPLRMQSQIVGVCKSIIDISDSRNRKADYCEKLGNEYVVLFQMSNASDSWQNLYNSADAYEKAGSYSTSVEQKKRRFLMAANQYGNVVSSTAASESGRRTSLLNKGKVYYLAEEYDKGIATFNAYISTYTEQAGVAAQYLGHCQVGKNQYKEGLQEYLTAIHDYGQSTENDIEKILRTEITPRPEALPAGSMAVFRSSLYYADTTQECMLQGGFTYKWYLDGRLIPFTGPTAEITVGDSIGAVQTISMRIDFDAALAHLPARASNVYLDDDLSFFIGEDWQKYCGYEFYFPVFSCVYGIKNGTGKYGDVNLFSGNVLFSETDVSIPLGKDNKYFQLSRTYNSRSEIVGPFGLGWTMNMGPTLRENTKNGSLTLIEGDGSKFDIFRNDRGDYVSPEGKYFSISKLSDGFAIGHKDGTTYNFNPNGDLTAVKDPGSSMINFEYTTSFGTEHFNFDETAKGRVAGVQDRLGNTSKWNLDSKGRLGKWESPLGNSCSFQYDRNHNITTLYQPDGYRKFEYDAKGNLSKARNTLDKIYQYSFSSDYSKLMKAVNPKGSELKNEYDSLGNLIKSTNPDNGTTTLEYNWRPGYVTAINDPMNGRTEITYDQYGYIDKIKDASSNITDVDYDIAGRIASVVDTRGCRTGYHWDIRDQLVRVEYPDSSEERFQYDIMGNLTAYIDGNGHVSRYEYDLAGNLKSKTDPLGNKTIYHSDAQGRLTQVTDPLGHSTFFEYDPEGRIVKETNAQNRVKKYVYDKIGYLVTEIDELGNVVEYERNTEGKVISQRDAGGIKTLYKYDDAGNVVEITDGSGNKTVYSHDAMNRLLDKTDPEGNKSEYRYDLLGRRVSSKDPLGNLTQFAFDPLGNLKEVLDALRNKTEYEYDALGNLTAVIDARGHKRVFERDPAGRISVITDPLGNSLRYFYDGAGNLIRKTDSFGTTVELTRNGNNQITVISAPDRKTYFEYDAAGNVLSAEENSIKISYEYDSLNRVIKTSWAPFNWSLQYEYDAAGNRISLRDNEKGVTNYTYDPRGLLTQIIDSYGSTYRFSYDSLGRRIQTIYPDNVQTSHVYSTAGRLTRLLTLNSGNVNIIDRQYRYDAAGNVVSVKEGANESLFRYDALNRLVSASYTDAASEIFEYDAVGNRTKLTGVGVPITTYIYDPADRLVSATTPEGRTIYGWNANGTLVRKITPGQNGTDEIHYTWDSDNRLVKAFVQTDETTEIRFGYDPLGRRIFKRVNDKRTYFQHDGDDVIAVYSSDIDRKTGRRDLALKEKYIQGLGMDEHLAMISSNPETGRSATNYFHQDERGSVLGVTDSAGQTVGKWTERAFGQRFASQAFNSPYGFTGREFEEELGLNFHRARLYDPAIGRFISRDPVFGNIACPMTQHPYIFGNLNPYVYTDPDGRWAQEVADWLRLKTLNPLKRGIGKAANVVQGIVGESAAIALETVGSSTADYLLGIPIGVLSLGTLGGEGVGEIESGIGDAGSYGKITLDTFGIVSTGYGLSGKALIGYKKFTRQASEDKISKVADAIEEYVGSDANLTINEAGDLVIESTDGTRKVRFDINDPSPHEYPHGHLEEFKRVKNKMIPTYKSGPIYPK